MTPTIDFFRDDWSFPLGAEEKVTLPEEFATTPEEMAFLPNMKAWDNYQNIDLYNLEKMLLKWGEEMIESGAWHEYGTGKERRYSVGMVFELWYGRKAEAGVDHKCCAMLKQLMGYYSTRIATTTYQNGKAKHKPCYYLSYRRMRDQPAYSLRLRMERLAEAGALPTKKNMQLVRRELKPGEARNPKTQEHMTARSERGRRLYAERQARVNDDCSDDTGRPPE